jgi:tetratricopeptide (TPR) repeat protein
MGRWTTAGSVASITLLLALTPAALMAARLEVASQPEGATVFLDDRYLGSTPLALDIDAAGAHLVRIQKRGFAVWRGTVELGPEPARVQAQLSPETLGRIEVVTDPSSADVYVDGRLVGKSPAAVDSLELDHHRVQIAKSGFRLEVLDVELTAADTQAKLEVSLTARVADYLVAHVRAHPEDVMAITDLAHEYAIRHQFDECLEMLGKGLDAVGDYGEKLDPDHIRRVYQEIERLHDKQFDYAPDEVVAGLQPRLLDALRAGIERRPANGYTYLCLAEQLIAQSDTEAALATLEEGAAKAEGVPLPIRLSGRAASLRYQRGTAAEKQKDWEGTLAAYEELAELHPKSWATENGLSRMVAIYGTHLSKPDEALKTARRLVAQFPDSPSCASVLSDVATHLTKAGQHEQAADLYVEIAETYPWYREAPEGLLTAARVYEQKLKAPERALSAWQKLIEIGGNSEAAAEARARAADILRTGGDAEAADALIAELLRDFPLSMAATLAETDEQRKARNEAARLAYRQVPRLYRQRNLDELASACENLITGYGDTYYACQAQRLLISAYRTQKDYEKEIAARQRFVELWPNHPDSPQNLYQAAHTLQTIIKDVPRAIAAYQQCVDDYPDSPMAEQSLHTLAQIWQSETEVIDYAKAMETFLRLANDFPHSEYARLARKYAADCQLELRDTERARAMYMEVMAENPHDYAAYLAAASGYERIRMRPDEE